MRQAWGLACQGVDVGLRDGLPHLGLGGLSRPRTLLRLHVLQTAQRPLRFSGTSGIRGSAVCRLDTLLEAVKSGSMCPALEQFLPKDTTLISMYWLTAGALRPCPAAAPVHQHTIQHHICLKRQLHFPTVVQKSCMTVLLEVRAQS